MQHFKYRNAKLLFPLFFIHTSIIKFLIIPCDDSVVGTLIQLNKARGDSTKGTKREVNALSDWTIAAVGKRDGYMAHYGPHLCLCNFGNSGYQSVTAK